MTARLAVSLAVAVAVAAVAFGLLAPGGGNGGEPVATADTGWSDEGRRVFAAMGCGSCHRLAAAGSTGTIGPSLDEELPGHDRASLVQSIVIAPKLEPGTMPADYGERMTGAELQALVSFLRSVR